MQHFTLSTAQLADIAGVSTTQISNDMQRRLLPSDQRPGPGRSRQFSERDAMHILFFYELRAARVEASFASHAAAEFASRAAQQAAAFPWKVEGGPTLLIAWQDGDDIRVDLANGYDVSRLPAAVIDADLIDRRLRDGLKRLGIAADPDARA